MNQPDYDEILEQVLNLAPDDQLRLLEDLAAALRQQLTKEPQHSILELEGLGEGVWHGRGIDAQEFVNQERDSWDK